MGKLWKVYQTMLFPLFKSGHCQQVRLPLHLVILQLLGSKTLSGVKFFRMYVTLETNPSIPVVKDHVRLHTILLSRNMRRMFHVEIVEYVMTLLVYALAFLVTVAKLAKSRVLSFN